MTANSGTLTARDRWLALLLLSAGALWLALDGRFYWHDIRFFYAVSEFSLSEILAGVFNPHQAWTVIDETSTAGFYSSKVLHLFLLQVLVDWLGPGRQALDTAVYLSVFMVSLSVLAGYRLLLKVTGSTGTAIAGVISLLLMPVVPYLAGKLLSEVTSLLLSLVALLLLAGACMQSGRRAILLAACSGVLVAMAALARLDGLFGIAGFVLAALIVPPRRATRTHMLPAMLVAGLVAAVIYATAMLLSGIGLPEIYEYFLALTGAGRKSILMSLLGIVTVGGVVLLLAGAGLFHGRRDLVLFFAAWLLLAWLPAMLITSTYMIEPRYLVAGVLPLAGLGALGIEWLAGHMGNTARRSIVPGLVVIAMAVTLNKAMILLMPYELHRPSLESALERITAEDADAVILVPWAYTDYHYLDIMLPGADIYNVHSPAADADTDTVQAWQRRYRDWYGSGYIGNMNELHALAGGRSIYYLGWQLYPPVENVRMLARAAGWDGLDHMLGGLGLMNHLEQSWVWHSHDIDRRYAGTVGQYDYYRLSTGGI